MDGLPALHELLAHTHLLTERQRQQGSLGQVGPLLCVHAEGTRDGESVAVDRFFTAAACSPNAALMAIRNYGPETDHLLFLLDAHPARLRAYERVGFRLTEMQWLMGLSNPRPLSGNDSSGIQIRRATGAADALLLAAIDGLEPVAQSDLRDPALMHYYCITNQKPTAYARNALYDETIHWVSHVHTAPGFRRQGFARALMSHLLSDCAQLNAQSVLLLATEMSHRLYVQLGFIDIAPVALLTLSSALLRRRKSAR